MATYVIGDVQGCLDELKLLLAQIDFNEAFDRLWFCGDLVNRGPNSLGVLRLVRKLSHRCTVVLGNHDIHLLAIVFGDAQVREKDTFKKLLKADDCEKLCMWLRKQPLLHYDPNFNTVLVHAGIPPCWDLKQALSYAAEVSDMLKDKDHLPFLDNIYGNHPDRWDDELKGWDRIRYITNALTRMRFCNEDGVLHLENKGSPDPKEEGFAPWYILSKQLRNNVNIVFGHWAALNGYTGVNHIDALDTGCVWGNRLTALRLDDRKFFHVPAMMNYAKLYSTRN